MERLGHEIRKLIDARKLTQKELSRRSGLREPTLSKILTGKARPRVSNLLRIADALKLGARERERMIALREGKTGNTASKSSSQPHKNERPAMSDEKSSAQQLLSKWSDATRLRRSVRRILEANGIDFLSDTLVGRIPVDIYIQSRSLAILCVATPELNVEVYIDLCELYRREGGIKKVILVFEKLDRFSETLDDDLPLQAMVTTRGEILKALGDPSMR